MRPEAPPEPPAALTGWLDKDALLDSSQASPGAQGEGLGLGRRRSSPTAARAWCPSSSPATRRPTSGAPSSRGCRCGSRGRRGTARPRRSATGTTRSPAAAHLVAEQEDQYELVLGTGLLGWRSPSGTVVRNHILTTRLIAIVDTDKDEVRIVIDPEAATRAQDRELLDGEPGYDPNRVESCTTRCGTRRCWRRWSTASGWPRRGPSGRWTPRRRSSAEWAPMRHGRGERRGAPGARPSCCAGASGPA